MKLPFKMDLPRINDQLTEETFSEMEDEHFYTDCLFKDCTLTNKTLEKVSFRRVKFVNVTFENIN